MGRTEGFRDPGIAIKRIISPLDIFGFLIFVIVLRLCYRERVSSTDLQLM